MAPDRLSRPECTASELTDPVRLTRGHLTASGAQHYPQRNLQGSGVWTQSGTFRTHSVRVYVCVRVCEKEKCVTSSSLLPVEKQCVVRGN